MGKKIGNKIKERRVVAHILPPAPRDNLALDAMDARAAGYSSYGLYKVDHPFTMDKNEPRLAKKTKPKPIKVYEFICAGCGKPFTTTNCKRRYCEDGCKKRKEGAEQRAANKRTKKECPQ